MPNRLLWEHWKISIHALREESDPWWMSTTTSLLRFLSTPSARRATGADFYLNLPVRISIHALREEGDLVAEPRGWRFVISIHALREEGDPRIL